MAVIQTAKMTAAQFLQLGEDPPGIRLELVHGEIEMSPSPTPQHSRVILQLSILLGSHIQSRVLGELLSDVDVPFGMYDTRRPDLLYFSPSRLHLVEAGRLLGVPDLAVEIVSPSSTKIDREVKFKQYEQGGVAHYWLVDPQERTFEAFTCEDGAYRKVAEAKRDETVNAPPFIELSLPLGRLWMD